MGIVRRGVCWAALLVFAPSGCGTLSDVGFSPCHSPKSSRPDGDRVYGGVRTDLEVVVGCLGDRLGSTPSWPLENAGLILIGTAYLALDLPLSAIVDTLRLPITIPAAFGKNPPAPAATIPEVVGKNPPAPAVEDSK